MVCKKKTGKVLKKLRKLNKKFSRNVEDYFERDLREARKVVRLN